VAKCAEREVYFRYS